MIVSIGAGSKLSCAYYGKFNAVFRTAFGRFLLTLRQVLYDTVKRQFNISESSC